MTTPARDDNLHHLLLSAAYSGISRNPWRGAVWVDGDLVTGTDPRLWGVAAMNEYGWLLWYPDTTSTDSCCLSPLGNQVLDAWDSELWQIPIRRPYSSRPLTRDAALAAEFGISESDVAKIRARFAALDHKHNKGPTT